MNMRIKDFEIFKKVFPGLNQGDIRRIGSAAIKALPIWRCSQLDAFENEPETLGIAAKGFCSFEAERHGERFWKTIPSEKRSNCRRQRPCIEGSFL